MSARHASPSGDSAPRGSSRPGRHSRSLSSAPSAIPDPAAPGDHAHGAEASAGSGGSHRPSHNHGHSHGPGEADHPHDDHPHDDHSHDDHSRGGHVHGPDGSHEDHSPNGGHSHGADGHHDHEHEDRAPNGGHSHGADGHHDHEHGAGLWNRLSHLVTPHSHDTAAKVDSAMESSREGLRALWISLGVLGATAALQAIVVVFSGSVALLGDTLHNVADALTAVPLGIAFMVGRRLPTRRYTYGYGRAEDLAGIVIVVFIAASAAVAGYEAFRRLLHPADVHYLGYVAAAALIGFAGNEIVARYRIAVGRRIGSAALVADGLHARTDGFTSLAVLLGAGGVAIGWRWADPVVGLAITIAIAFVLVDAAREVYRRLMDAVDPDLVDKVGDVLAATPGVLEVGDVHLRWIGHQLRAECEIAVEPTLPVSEAHAIAVDAEHRLIHAVPRLTRAFVHADPAGEDAAHHAELSHHTDNRHGAGVRRAAHPR